MKDDDVNEIVEAVHLWAEAHPARDTPFIQLGRGVTLTPREMAEAIADPDSPHGKLLLEMVQEGQRVFPLHEILNDLMPEEQRHVLHSTGYTS
ncbi:hypothetical protein OV450_7606 [Actinobacteria bacterium OV450]|nr:hypothetical protein OV450_7606 [Actinobacteria bacterium OV450]